MMRMLTCYYQQFDADLNADVPAEGYGGWKTADLPFDLEHTALVVMHAWDCGSPADFPGWRRAVEYMPRAEAICRDVFPELLEAVRRSPMPVFHVVGGGAYYKDLPGYLRAAGMATAEPQAEPAVSKSQVRQSLDRFHSDNVFVGKHNRPDVQKGFQKVDFDVHARPVGDEGIAENRSQLLALCRHHAIDHLVYVGFAINWCILLSPGGMADMSGYGLMCSTIPEAVTAVENKETARDEIAKQIALWRVALAFGYVYRLADFLEALKGAK